jgi:1-deoxy-D-xylulose-5-phosphate reductoisomerase
MPDMRVPILYALGYPHRVSSDLPRMDFKRCSSLTFFEPDLNRFRNLFLAYGAMEKGGNMPCIMNAANEVAVKAFLNEEVGFLQMSEIVEYTMNSTSYSENISLDLLERSDADARETAREYINKIIK